MKIWLRSSRVIASFLSAALLWPSQTAWSVGDTHMALGMAEEGISPSAGAIVFKNILDKASVWVARDAAGNNIPNIVLDSDGYPIPQPGVLYSTSLGTNMRDGFFPGEYVVAWDNDGVVSPQGAAVSNVVAGDHRTTFTLSANTGMAIRIDKDNPANHVNNIRVMEQRFESDYLEHPFYPDWLSLNSNFKCMRTMGWSGVFPTPTRRITGTAVSWTPTTVDLGPQYTQPDGFYKHWLFSVSAPNSPTALVEDSAGSVLTLAPAMKGTNMPTPLPYTLDLVAPRWVGERTLPSEIQKTTSRGMSWEELAKAGVDFHGDLWLNIPTMADDDFIAEMAHYFHQNFSAKNPGQKIYLEYSNEVFNFSGEGFWASRIMAPYYGLKQLYYWNSMRCCQIFHIWNQEYGEDDLTANRRTSQLVRLIGWLAADAGGSQTKAMLDFNQWPANEPYHLAGADPAHPRTASEYADALSIAPYASFYNSPNGTMSLSDFANYSLGQTMSAFQTGADKAYGWTKGAATAAAARHLQLVIYEGSDAYSFAPGPYEWDRVKAFVKAVYHTPLYLSIYLNFLNELDSLNDASTGAVVSLYTSSAMFFFENNPGQYPGPTGQWGCLATSVNPQTDNYKWQAYMSYLNRRVAPVWPDVLTADAINASQINLHWSDNSNNETSFSLERKDGNGSFSVLTTLAANTSSYADTMNIAPSSRYTYRVRAANTDGFSEYSNEANVRTPDFDTDIPLAPWELRASIDSQSSIRVHWINPADATAPNATAIVVQREVLNKDGSVKTAFADIATVDPTDNFYIDSGLPPSTGGNQSGPYVYRVFAIRGIQRSLPSNESEEILLNPSYTVDPNSPNLVASTTSSGDVQLTWTVKSTIDQNFTIERSTGPEGSAGPVGWTDLATTADAATLIYTDAAPPAGIYYYQLKIPQTTGATIFSNTAIADVHPASFYVPVAPSYLEAQAVGSSQIYLSWTDNSNSESGFTVERLDSGTNTWNAIATLQPNVTNFSDTSLAVSTAYSYRVKATASPADSAYSNTASATTLAASFNGTLSISPASLSATAVSTTEIDLKWIDDSINEDNYVIERLNSTGSWNAIANLAAESTSFSNTGLTPATSYSYRVRAGNSAGVSSPSNVATVSTFNLSTAVDPPAKPTNLQVGIVTVNSVELEWTDNATSETAYLVEQEGPDGLWVQIAALGPDATRFTASALNPSTKYFFRVKTRNGAGDSFYSDPVGAFTQSINSSSAPPSTGFSSNEKLVITPSVVNFGKGDCCVTISNLSKSTTRIRVFKPHGPVRAEAVPNSSSSIQIDLTKFNLSAGVVFVETQGGEKQTAKLVILK